MREDGKSEFVGTKEAAELICCSMSTVSRLCREGRIKGAEQDAKGSPWRIPRKTIEEILSKRGN